MTEDTVGHEGVEFDPASMAMSSLSASKMVWWRRPWVLITLVIVVIVAISVITDLPHPISNAEDVASQKSTMVQINTDVKQCTFAVKESFGFYRREASGHVSASQLNVIKTYLVNDQTVCSFAGPGMSELTNNLQVLDTPAGKYIDQMLKVVVTWMDSDANGAINDIQKLTLHPDDTKTLSDLAKRVDFLNRDRQLALDDLAKADDLLGVTLPTLDLPAVAPLPLR